MSKRSLASCLSDMAILVPARAGSKRIPGKNMRPVGGKPLLYWTLKPLHDLGFLNRTWVLTDYPEAARYANAMGARVMVRPARLADGPMESLVQWAVASPAVASFRHFLLLQPTSPLRDRTLIQLFLEHVIRQAPVACHSVYNGRDNGAFYYFTWDWFASTGLIRCPLAEPYHMLGDDSVDVDEYQDLIDADAILRSRNVSSTYH